MTIFSQKKWFLFSLILIVTLIPCLTWHLHRADKLYKNETECKWLASQYWISSANTFRETGTLLAFQNDSGRLVPFEAVCVADDIGHSLFISLISKGFDIEFSPIKVIYFNAFFNFFAMIITLIFFYKLRLFSIAAMLLFVTAFFFVYTKPFYSPHYAGLGMVAFISIMPFSLLALIYNWCSKKTALFFLFAGILFLMISTLMRSVFGYFGLATGLFLLGFMFWKSGRDSKTGLFCLLTATLIIGAWLSPKWTLLLRNSFFSFEESSSLYEKSVWEGPHGISHNLFIGLGNVPNKWGIEYSDLAGYEFARKIDPSTVYASNQHFTILKNLYFQYLKEDPIEVLRIYYEKCKLALKYPPFLISALIFPCFLFTFFLREPLSRRKELPIFLLSTMGVLFFILQGILAHPGKYYIGPGILFSCIQCGVGLQYLFRIKIFQKPRFIQERLSNI